MKKLVLLVVALAAFIGICYGAAVAIDNHYKTSQKQKEALVPTITVKQSDAKVEAVKTAAAGEYQSLVVKYNGQVTECQKGLVAYGKLTTIIKNQTPSPVCGALIQ